MSRQNSSKRSMAMRMMPRFAHPKHHRRQPAITLPGLPERPTPAPGDGDTTGVTEPIPTNDPPTVKPTGPETTPVTETTTRTTIPAPVTVTSRPTTVATASPTVTTPTAVVISTAVRSTSTITSTASVRPVNQVSAASASTRGTLTSVVIASATLSSSSTISNLAASSTPSSSSGPSAGSVVGIVAGALIGVVVISGLIGYLFRTKFGNKDDGDEDIFARAPSVLLPDGDDGMSEYSGLGRSNTVFTSGGLSRAGTNAGGLSRAGTNAGGPRPPSFIERHYNAPAANVQPGQTMPYAQAYPYYPYPPQQPFIPNPFIPNPPSDPRDSGSLPSRSGTPVNPNPQTAYYHGYTDSGASVGSNPVRQAGRSEEPTERQLKTLSVRNGDDEADYLRGDHRPMSMADSVSDAYGGI